MQLDPDAAAVLETLNSPGRPSYDQLSVEEARAAYEAARAATTGEPVSLPVVRDISLDGPAGPIPARLYRPRPENGEALPALVFFHGGGWVLGGLDSHDGLCRRLASASGCAVVAVDYRLAPEHRFPAAFEDALAATRAVTADAAGLGVDPARLAVGGDSAGGNLAAAVCLALRGDEPRLRYQMLIYPAVDFAMDTESQRLFAEGHFLTAALQRWFHAHYLGEEGDREDWRASPLRADSVAGLPPAFVLTASHDPLRDEGEAWAARLVAEGGRATTWRVPGQIHGFLPLDGAMRVSAQVAELLGRHLALELAG
ncbi:MAG: alpha/beta hydrolase [Pseudomonadota bacterium]